MALENTHVVREQGGNVLRIKSGGSVVVESGGVVELQAGATLETAGDQTVASGAFLTVEAGGTVALDGTLDVDASAVWLVDGSALSGVADLGGTAGGTADSTLVTLTAALVGVDGTGSNAAPLAGVNSRWISIANDIEDIKAKQNTILARLRSLKLFGA